MWIHELTTDTAKRNERGASYNPATPSINRQLRFTKRFTGGETVHRVTTYRDVKGTRKPWVSEAFRNERHARAYLDDLNAGIA